jgi:2-polyprenyl-6-hydroxyphenyl methylase / 3-demethylubiquinone-9 3-methyltransferase
MPIDNQLYDRLADHWWSDDSVLALLRTSVNPPRIAYIREQVAAHLGDPHGVRALDVGCGGGLLAEEVARLGCRVTGIDPSAQSVEAAAAHARDSGLPIEYVTGPGEQLPFGDGSFDLVYCCDVLEHVADLQQVLNETRRVLRPGGLYVYDTINRTRRSRLVMIKLFQEWRSVAFMEPDLHDWNMFIRPEELTAGLRRAGLEPGEQAGITPGRSPIGMLMDMRRRARGELTYEQLGERIPLRLGGGLWGSYAGWARKPA